MNKANIKFYLVFILALILGVSIDYLFYGKPIGISFFIFVLIFTAFALILAQKFRQKLSKIQCALIIPAVLFSAMVFCRASSFLTFFNVVGSVFLLLLFLVLFLRKNLLDFNLLSYFTAPLGFLIESFGKSARFIEASVGRLKAKREIGSPEFWSVIRGLVLAIPILAVLIWLLASADIVFQKYLTQLLDISINPELVLRILIILLGSYFFIGLFARTFAAKSPAPRLETTLSENNQAKSSGLIESFVVLGLVELLFSVFIVIQFFYLFGGKTYVWGIEEYITYSEYAKKGFCELVAVAIISFLIIYAIDRFGRKETPKKKRIFQILSSILTVEIVIIMVSALRRLSLYVDGYGYTVSRLLSFVFLFWLFCIFLLFLYKIFSEQKQTHFIFALFCLTLLFWFGLNILNPEAFVARRNIERAAQGKELDTRYLNQLSDDAVPEMMKIFETKAYEQAKIDIVIDFNYRYLLDDESIHHLDLVFNTKRVEAFKEAQKWQSFSLARHKAIKTLLEHSQTIKQYHLRYWQKEEAQCRKDLESCEREWCEKEFANKPQKIIECKEVDCSHTREYCQDCRENIDILKRD